MMLVSSLSMRALAALSLSACLVVIGTGLGVRAAEPAVTVPAPLTDEQKLAGPPQTAVLAGGCFWGVQGVFEHLKGVQRVVSGYAGGNAASADYETVSSGSTGHAESVQIVFDPKEVTYGEILQVYFSVAHNPTELNRQGPDSGTQYRSAIFYANDAQKRIATAYIAQLSAAKTFGKPIVTRVDRLQGFYAAEGYHQDFLIKNPNHPYIVFNDLPKIRNLQKSFPAQYRDAPVTVAARQ